MPNPRIWPDRPPTSTPATGAPVSSGSQPPHFHLPPAPAVQRLYHNSAATPNRSPAANGYDADYSPNMSFNYLPSLGAIKGGDVGEQSMRGMLQVSPQVRPSSSGSNGIGGFRPKAVRKQSRLSRGSPIGNGETPAGIVGPSTRSRWRASSPLEDDEEMEVDPLLLEPDDSSWNAIDNMRLWRHDAIMQHLYETAAFWGDKILSWTGEYCYAGRSW